MKDMSLQSNLKKDCFYSTFRNLAVLNKDEVLSISDK